MRALVCGARDGGPLAPVALATVVLPALGAAVLAATAATWWPRLTAAQPSVLAWYCGAAIVLCALSLVPTHAASLVGGMLFGAAGGSGAAILSVVGAAWLGFVLMRRWASRAFERFLRSRPRARAVHAALVERPGWQAVGLVALVRLSPVMPFAGTNLLFASAAVGTPAFVCGSALGLTPRVVAVAVLGAGLESFDASRGPGWVFLVGGIAATLALLWILGRIARGRLRELGLAG